jgi:hypothetical protein
MSCNQNFFQREEEVVRTDGYGALILKGIFKDIDFWTYTASTDGKYHINKRDNKLSVPCDDSLYGTFEKTQKTFRLLLESDIEFDFIFRTNLSTHVNPWVITLFVEELPENFKEKIFSPIIYCSKDSTGPDEYSLYAVGNSMLIPRKRVEEIAYADLNDILKDNNIAIDDNKTLIKIDDNCIGLIINTLAKRRGEDPWNMWCQTRRTPYITKELIETGNYSYSFGVPLRDYKKGSTRSIELVFFKILAENMRYPKPGANITPEFMFEFQTKSNLLTIVDFKMGTTLTVPRKWALEFKNSGLSLEEFDKILEKRIKKENL